MRPHTVAEACLRVTSGEPWDRMMEEFLQSYYLADATAARVAMLAEEPILFKDERYNALVGAIAEYLYKRWTPEHVPPWIAARTRYLHEPWFPNVGDDPGLREYLTFASPPEFKSRNIMTDEEPLRRAAGSWPASDVMIRKDGCRERREFRARPKSVRRPDGRD